MGKLYFIRKGTRENPEYEGKGDTTMAERSEYVGKIKNSSTQNVKAPHQSTDAKKGTVKTGKDLRCGKK